MIAMILAQLVGMMCPPVHRQCTSGATGYPSPPSGWCMYLRKVYRFVRAIRYHKATPPHTRVPQPQDDVVSQLLNPTAPARLKLLQGTSNTCFTVFLLDSAAFDGQQRCVLM